MQGLAQLPLWQRCGGVGGCGGSAVGILAAAAAC